jgi:hypothetical protein
MVIKFFLLYFLLFPVANSANWPRPSEENCDFYTKLESELHCKDEGVDYLSNYAPFYCEAFSTKSKVWKTPMKEWAQKTGLCLQEMLYEHRSNPDFNCKNLEDLAFKTHTACYNETELCQLKIKDIAEILKVIKFKDFLLEFRYSPKEMIRLGRTCIGKWISE